MDNTTRRGVGAMLDPLRRRISMMASRGVVRTVSDNKSRQQLQAEILEGELREDVERAQNYGLAAHPHPGSDAIILCLGGSREQTVAIVVDDRRYKLNLQAGEVALYDDLGNKVQLLRDMVRVDAVQHLEATAPTTRIVSDVTIDGTLTVNGDVATSGALTNNGKDVGSSHKHLNSGGPSLGGPPQ